MTPAVNYLKTNGIEFEILSYEHNVKSASYGLEAAEKLKLPQAQVFKTLVVALANGELITALLPVSATLDMKAIAKCMHTKSAKMASPSQVQSSTGYILGGVSPFGQKKTLNTLVDISAKVFERIYVSAGKRGLELAISPVYFARCLNADFATITKKAR